MSAVILDFDGTISDSLPTAIKLFYEWSGREPFSASQVEEFRNMPLKKVLPRVGLPLWKIPSLIVKARSEFGKHITEVPIFKGMPAVLKALHDDGHQLYLMSSNGPQNIRRFLRQHDVIEYFDGIHGNTGLFNKASAMRALLRKHKIDPSACYSIGDESRDVDAANKVGLTSIAVAWGYNGEKILREHNPDHIAHKPQDILKLIQ
jgi:phosphoglycolate phosphatase